METISRHNLPRERLVELIEAYRFDVYDEPMASLAALQAYAARDRGAIYECARRILGVETALPGLPGRPVRLKRLPNFSACRSMRRTISCTCHWKFFGIRCQSRGISTP